MATTITLQAEAQRAIDALLAETPLDQWAHDCHAASISLVQRLPERSARVARGTARGVGSQHSWVVLGMDCYDLDATIIDLTLWSYRDDVEGVWVGTMRNDVHRPHGYSEEALMQWGCPRPGDGDHIDLTPSAPLSSRAQLILDMFREHVGTLDRTFWSRLVNYAPMNDSWPAAEIVAAMADTSDVCALVPIDILGMMTERNPNGLYLRSES